MLNVMLWVAQIAAAVVFALAGTAKLGVPRERLAARMHWAATWPRSRIKLLGLAELAGAVGLVAPAATGLVPVLTPIAAACLFVLMLGAVRTHVRLGESVAAAAVIAALCAVIAIGRAP